MQVVADVDEADIAGVAEGARVTFTAVSYTHLKTTIDMSQHKALYIHF